MKKHILLCAALALSSFGLPSCSDILDQKPLDSYTDTAVWSDLSLAESFLNYCYLRVEAENTNGVMFCNSTSFVQRFTPALSSITRFTSF